ncbi:hypothetical protein AB0D15_31100, partial [Streptomyces sp. NPDC048551]
GGGTTHHGGTDTTHTGASHDTPTTGGGGHDGPTIPHQGDHGPGGGTPGAGAENAEPPAKVRKPEESWPAKEDIVGTARGKDLMYPNSRHNLSGIRGGQVDTKNTIILPETKELVKQDISEIAAGRAEYDPLTQKYTVNGRTYGVEHTGRTFPVSGPE